MTSTILKFAVAGGLLVGASQLPVHAQETQKQEAAEGDGSENTDAKWHLINSGLFALGLGWAIWKLAPAFFNARSADIQKAIKDATGLKLEADLRYSEIDRKMATLPDEVKGLKEQAALEMDREHRRRQDETARDRRRIEQAGAAEAEALRQDAIRQARLQTARNALQLAEQRLAARVSGSSNDELLQDFIHLVERGKN